MGDGLTAWRVLVATVLVNLGLAGMVGAWASLLWLRGDASTWSLHLRRRSSSALKVALAFTVVSDALLLWVQAGYMAEVPLTDALAMLPGMLKQTYLGRAWSGGAMGLLLVLLAVSGRAPMQRNVRLTGAALGISLFIYSRAAVSHANELGLDSLPLLVECAHLWAISLWLGVVGVAGFVILAGPAGTAVEQAEVSRWVQTLSAVATGSLIVVAGTGLFNAWRGVGSVANVMGSAYGNTLLVKVGLVVVATALGGLNRFGVMPRLLADLRAPLGRATRPQQRFVQVLRIETIVLLAALVAAAVLSFAPLPSAR